MYHAAELVHWMHNRDKKILLPAQVDIDLTNICNQDCYYCNSADHRAAAPVQKKYTAYIELLDKLNDWRAHSPNSYGTTHTITYPGGGEPTMLPGYEHVIEHTIDLGFLTSMTTNGSRLDRLLNSVPVNKLKKIAWIGIDIDAGTEDLYEQIRNSLTKKSLFHKMKSNAKALVEIGTNVDFKVLLNPFNDNTAALKNIFLFVKEVGGRLIHFRPVIHQGRAHQITDSVRLELKNLAALYNVPYQLVESKTDQRTYRRCHQMYHFPVFCADGHIYVCCENKGNSNFSLARWDQGDFRDQWMQQKHHDIYVSTRVEFCQPCRPNKTNNMIQDLIDDPKLLETLYL